MFRWGLALCGYSEAATTRTKVCEGLPLKLCLHQHFLPDDVDIEGAPQHVLMFLEHFYSIPYITYRCGFPAILNSSYTTDCGWGCMIRSGQMMLATALHCHLLGKGL